MVTAVICTERLGNMCALRKMIHLVVSVPEWVMWKTMDCNGDIYGWEKRPRLVLGGWEDGGEFVYIANDEHNNEMDFRKSLTKVA